MVFYEVAISRFSFVCSWSEEGVSYNFNLNVYLYCDFVTENKSLLLDVSSDVLAPCC